MPKELTHIIIAQEVLARLKASDPIPMLGSISDAAENNEQAFFFGAIVPDAFFYNLLPWPPVPSGIPVVTKILHQKERQKNDKMAENLLIAASTSHEFRSLKVAFSAGILTHTVSDRIFHGVIDYYVNRWDESGTRAMGTHRQLETLFDMTLLDLSDRTPGDFPLEGFTSLALAETNSLLRFIVSFLVHPPAVLQKNYVRAFKWAYTQQIYLLRLFRRNWAFRPAHWARQYSGGRSDFISSLFYPPVISPETCPVLERINVHDLTDGINFEGDLPALTQRVTNQAVRRIQRGFDLLRQGDKIR